MPDQTLLLNAAAINRVLMRIAHEIAERHENSQAMALIGIQRGGVHLAHRLGGQLQAIWGHSVPVGSLDVSMHRDDLGRQAAPKVHPMIWNRKHLLDIESLTVAEINTVHATARAFKAVGERAIKKVPALRGKTVVNLFIEPSTRTRISFELAALRLTADIINFSAEASSLKKGETLKDTARNLEALNADIIIIRHSATGAAHFLARFLKGSVVNAGDGAHEHPTQALLDTFTIRERKGRIAGLNVTILGDILYSRVARSNIWALTRLGAKVTLCGPSTLVPRVFEQMGCRVTYNVEEAVAGADIINLLRIQHERRRRSRRDFFRR